MMRGNAMPGVVPSGLAAQNRALAYSSPAAWTKTPSSAYDFGTGDDERSQLRRAYERIDLLPPAMGAPLSPRAHGREFGMIEAAYAARVDRVLAASQSDGHVASG